MIRRTFTFFALALIVWALVASSIAGYYYYQYNILFGKTRKIIDIDIGVNYGNGTVKWFNDTKAKTIDTLFEVTIRVATVNYTGYMGTGVFVTAINGVANPHLSSKHYWIWWTRTTEGWTTGPVGCDQYFVNNNETYYWYYEDTSTWPPLSPP